MDGLAGHTVEDIDRAFNTYPPYLLHCHSFTALNRNFSKLPPRGHTHEDIVWAFKKIDVHVELVRRFEMKKVFSILLKRYSMLQEIKLHRSFMGL